MQTPEKIWAITMATIILTATLATLGNIQEAPESQSTTILDSESEIARYTKPFLGTDEPSWKKIYFEDFENNQLDPTGHPWTAPAESITWYAEGGGYGGKGKIQFDTQAALGSRSLRITTEPKNQKMGVGYTALSIPSSHVIRVEFWWKPEVYDNTFPGLKNGSCRFEWEVSIEEKTLNKMTTCCIAHVPNSWAGHKPGTWTMLQPNGTWSPIAQRNLSSEWHKITITVDMKEQGKVPFSLEVNGQIIYSKAGIIRLFNNKRPSHDIMTFGSHLVTHENVAHNVNIDNITISTLQ